MYTHCDCTVRRFDAMVFSMNNISFNSVHDTLRRELRLNRNWFFLFLTLKNVGVDNITLVIGIIMKLAVYQNEIDVSLIAICQFNEL